MRLNKSAPVGILPLMQVQINPRTPCAHCQHEAGSLLFQVILYFLGQESLLPKLQDKVVIFFDPGTSPASTTSATDRPCTSRLCNTRFFLTAGVQGHLQELDQGATFLSSTISARKSYLN